MTQPIPRTKDSWINLKTFEDIYLLEQEVEKHDYIAIDTETTGLKVSDTVFGISFAVGSINELEYVFWYNLNFDAEHQLKDRVIAILRKLFAEDNKKKLIFHNASFDLRMLKMTFGLQLKHKFVHDSMKAALVLRTFPLVGLKPLTTYLFKDYQPAWAIEVDLFFKGLGMEKDPYYPMLEQELVFNYACEDAENTFLVFWELTKFFNSKDLSESEQKNLKNTYALERLLTPSISEMELEGMAIDIDYKDKLKVLLKKRIIEIWSIYNEKYTPIFEAENRLRGKAAKVKPQDRYELTGAKKGFNLNSNAHLSTLLFDRFVGEGFRLDSSRVTETRTGHISVGHEDIELAFGDDPKIKEILEYKFYETLLKKITEIESVMNKRYDPLNKVFYHTTHTNYRMADTGRFTSSKINLQNLPNEKKWQPWQQQYSLRKMFVAPEGYLYLTMDFKAFEVRALANACQDPLLIEHCLTGVDFHSVVASGAYNRPYEEIANKVDALAIKQRTDSKELSFLLIYGGGIPTAHVRTKIPKENCKRVKDAVEQTYSYMNAWRELIKNECIKSGKIWTLCGRLRRIREIKNYHTGIVNTICQGTCADLIKYAHCDLYYLLLGRKSKQVMSIHDEIHMWVHPDDIDIIPDIVECLERRRFNPPNHGPGTYVPFEAELSIGDNWYDMKQVSVEEIQEKLRSMKNG